MRELTVVYWWFDYGRRGYVGLFRLLDVTMIIELQLAVVCALLPFPWLDGSALSSILLEASALLI